MPLYEYYCRDCNGVFEMLRPARAAAVPQPCPECDTECERLMPIDFAAFTVRDGLPRRIPDRGTFWHLGHEVNRPVNEPAYSYQHPDIDKTPPPAAPSAEEMDRFEHKLDVETEQDAEAMARNMFAIQPQRDQERLEFVQRLQKTGGLGRLRPRVRRRVSE